MLSCVNYMVLTLFRHCPKWTKCLEKHYARVIKDLLWLQWQAQRQPGQEKDCHKCASQQSDSSKKIL